MKKLLAVALSAVLAAAPLTAGFAENGVTVFVDGVKQTYDVMPFVENERTMVPMRGIFEVLGADVEWDEATSTVTATRGPDTVKLTIGDATAYVNGEAVTLDQAPVKTNDRTLVPLRFVSETLDCKVTWEADSNTAVISSKENDNYWWYKFPTQGEGYEKTDAVGARSVRTNYSADFNWGHATQRQSYEEQKAGREAQPDTKMVSYYEAAGQCMLFSVAYEKNPDGTFKSYIEPLPGDVGKMPQLSFNAWSWTEDNLAKANYFDFVGPHQDANDGEINGDLFSRANTGLSEPTYPDGTSALGYFDEAEMPYPLNAKVYDAVMGKDINGKLYFQGDFKTDDPALQKGAAELTVGSEYLPTYVGYNEGEKVYFRKFDMNKDVSSPWWDEYEKVTFSEMNKAEVDGAWFDNFSPWDNFGNFEAMFGEWTVANFRTYLKENVSAERLAELGITDVNSFDIREYIKSAAAEMGAENPEDTKSAIYNSEEWIDDPVWSIFKVFKSEEGATHLKNLYRIAKEETADRPEGFAVLGNDIPKVNHTWVEDSYLDIVGSEIGFGWDLTMGARGMGLPPFGKMAGFEKVSRAQQKGPYPILWLYNAGDAAGKTELGKVLLAEAFANNTFVKYNDNTVGTEESHKWLNEFAEREEENLSGRYDYADIAILWSPQNQLMGSVPNSTSTGPDLDKQWHMQGLWGFSQAMIDGHVPYKVVPEWKLGSQTLQGIKTLIVPSMEAMSEEQFEVLKQFAEDGGRLVMTGATGTRYGKEGFFEKRTTGLFEDLIMKDTTIGAKIRISQNASEFNRTVNTVPVGNGEIVWTANPYGHEYFQSGNNRDELLPGVLELIGGTDMLDGSQLPQTVGVFPYTSANGKELWVDLVNYNVDAIEDVVTPQGALTFKVKLPEGMSVREVTGIRPEGNITLDAQIENGYATVTVPELTYYTSVKFIRQ